MKRVWLAVLALIVPLAGFECTIEVDHPDWTVGGECNFATDYPDNSYCRDADTIMICGYDNRVQDVDCGTDCPSGAGTCVTDIWGYGWCQCEDGWEDGSNCNYWTDFPTNGYCGNATTLYICNIVDSATDTHQIQAWDCASECEGGDGFCAFNPDLGYDWCQCPDWQWAPDYPCDYSTQYDDATCGADNDLLTYCSETNIIGAISCQGQCESTYGADATGVCGEQPDTGYNGCVCTFPTCNHGPYCNDSLWLVQCNADATADEWIDCNNYCVSEMGAVKGVCEAGACYCG